jgi:hypothetical protein
MIVIDGPSGEKARQKFNEFTSPIQPRRSVSSKQKKAALLKQQMESFDVRAVEASMNALLLAAEEVEQMDTEHPIGYYAATANTTG